MPCIARLVETADRFPQQRRASRAGRNGLTRLSVILAVAVAAPLLSIGVAVAAGQDTGASSFGAGSSVLAACGSGVTASYTTAYASSIRGYDISRVNLASIPAACLGEPYRIQLTGDSGFAVGSEMTGTLPTSGTTAAIPTLDAIDARLVTGVSVVIA